MALADGTQVAMSARLVDPRRERHPMHVRRPLCGWIAIVALGDMCGRAAERHVRQGR